MALFSGTGLTAFLGLMIGLIASPPPRPVVAPTQKEEYKPRFGDVDVKYIGPRPVAKLAEKIKRTARVAPTDLRTALRIMPYGDFMEFVNGTGGDPSKAWAWANAS